MGDSLLKYVHNSTFWTIATSAGGATIGKAISGVQPGSLDWIKYTAKEAAFPMAI